MPIDRNGYDSEASGTRMPPAEPRASTRQDHRAALGSLGEALGTGLLLTALVVGPALALGTIVERAYERSYHPQQQVRAQVGDSYADQHPASKYIPPF